MMEKKFFRMNLRRNMISDLDQVDQRKIHQFRQRRQVHQSSKVPSKEAENKSDQQQQHHVKVSVPEIKEAEKQSISFSLEHEINKIKIPIPLIELMKTDPFKKTILKSLQPPTHVTSF
jgi:hypothetical protein